MIIIIIIIPRLFLTAVHELHLSGNMPRIDAALRTKYRHLDWCFQGSAADSSQRFMGRSGQWRSLHNIMAYTAICHCCCLEKLRDIAQKHSLWCECCGPSFSLNPGKCDSKAIKITKRLQWKYEMQLACYGLSSDPSFSPPLCRSIYMLRWHHGVVNCTWMLFDCSPGLFKREPTVWKAATGNQNVRHLHRLPTVLLRCTHKYVTWAIVFLLKLIFRSVHVRQRK